jgi:hypothetical protein
MTTDHPLLDKLALCDMHHVRRHMKLHSLLVTMIFVGFTPFALCQPKSEPPNVCETGPLTRQYGGTEWYVYSCSDSRSLVVVASPNNPAAKPNAFIVSSKDGVKRLNGAGEMMGTVLATYDDLKALKQADISALITDTKNQTRSSVTKNR